MAMVQHIAALSPVTAPVCSVCVANYNGVAVLGDCIDSVLAQRGNITIEIIVHDDASVDESIAFLREHYPQVEILASAENVGFCVSNNRMVALARGEYVLLLNNDAALYPDAVGVLLAEIRKMPQQGILTLPQYDWATGKLVDRGCLLDPFYNPVPNLDAKRRDVAYVIGACLFLPRALWNDLGGFPEWMGSLAEDIYLCCLARLLGLPVIAIDRSGYRHRQGATFGGNRVRGGHLITTYRRRALSERNKTMVLVVCTPTWLTWVLLALHLMLLVAEGGTLVVFKRDTRIWREVYAATVGSVLRRIRRLRVLRASVQKRRLVTLRRYLRVFVCMPRKFVLLRRYGVPGVR
jgi:GT2 family glycosyltransferase